MATAVEQPRPSRLVTLRIRIPKASETKTDTPKPANPSPGRKRKRVEETTPPPPPPRVLVEPPEENLTDEERALRIAEAEILFPKYMSFIKFSPRGRSKKSDQGKSGLLYLPSKEYNAWDGDCSPWALDDPQERSRVEKHFASDFRKFGQPLAKNGPNPIELDPRYYDQEWNRRICPIQAPVIEPPKYGSLDDQPTFSTKRVKRAEDRLKMDGFILALKNDMGAAYVSRDEARYFPRSNGRREIIYDEKTGKPKVMKNGHLDLDLALRYREVKHKLEIIKTQHQLQGFPWNDDIEKMWEERNVKYVDADKKALGRTHYLEQEELGKEVDRTLYSEPEGRAVQALLEISTQGLGEKYYWTEVKQGFVSLEEVRK